MVEQARLSGKFAFFSFGISQHKTRKITLKNKNKNSLTSPKLIKASLPKRDTRTYNINKLAKVSQTKVTVQASLPTNPYNNVDSGMDPKDSSIPRPVNQRFGK